MNKLLLGLGTVSAVAFPFLSAVSCGTVNDPFDTGIDNGTENYYGAELSKLAPENKQSVVLITALGKVNDKSFNQSINAGLELYGKQTKQNNGEISFIETKVETDLDSAYSKALKEKRKVWVLSGFQQKANIKNWMNKPGNKDKFIKLGAVIVGVDWDGTTIVPQGHFFGLGFRAEQAAWVVGMAASEYYSKTISPFLNTFGGLPSDSVTNFTNGFLQGMLDWNTSQDKNNTNKFVQFRSGNEKQDSVNLNLGFDSQAAETVNEVKKIIGTGEEAPQIILPVAGSLTTNVLEDIRNKKSKQLVIGVDSNQAVTFPSFSKLFFSSIEKKVGLAVYKSLILLSGITLNYNDKVFDDNGFEGEFSKNEKNAVVKYGFNKGFVGVSESTVEDKVEINKLLVKYKSQFLDKSEKGEIIFKDMTVETANQKILNDMVIKINKFSEKREK